ncbi:MAG: glycine betaine ABC transporter substrate-binding protein, partial [Phycisphaerales bacterium JB038]
MRRRLLAAVLLLPLLACPAWAQTDGVLRVGAKNFTEQEILGELVAQLIEGGTDLRVQRRFGLAGTDICHAALLAGEIDLYVEYTGTGLLTVLRREVISNRHVAYRVVASEYRQRFDLEWLPPFGFNNTYALTVRGVDAAAEGWNAIGDLAADADSLRAGFTSEFMERPDGYPGLSEAYGFSFGDTVDLDPGLMYDAASKDQVDLICAFATDGRIAEYGLRTLEDDRGFFPPYDAAPVARREALEAHPELRAVLAVLAGAIDDEAMRRMNHAVDVGRQEPTVVARRWIEERFGSLADLRALEDSSPAAAPVGLLSLASQRRAEVLRKTAEHLILTALGTCIAIAIGVPLGVLIHRQRAVRGPVLAGTEVVQTIPSLAMLAFLFAVYGLLGRAPAVTALVLYALLPIVLNTFTGLREVPSQVLQAADGVGMSSWQKLRMVELPLAAPVIIAGIRAATVLTVGIATLSTYIGAGGPDPGDDHRRRQGQLDHSQLLPRRHAHPIGRLQHLARHLPEA